MLLGWITGIFIELPKSIIITIPYFKAFWFIILFVLLPMIIGVRLRSKATRPIAIIGTLAFIAFIILTLEERQHATRSLNLGALSLMVLFILLAMLLGWLMGGPKKGTRQILASAGSMRNAALALIVVENAFPNMDYEAPIVAFSALMVLPNLIFTVIMMLRR